jgi:hypothetical protein
MRDPERDETKAHRTQTIRDPHGKIDESAEQPRIHLAQKPWCFIAAAAALSSPVRAYKALKALSGLPQVPIEHSCLISLEQS